MNISQFNPIHPGEFIKSTYLEPFDLGINQLASNLDVSPSTFASLVNRQIKLHPDMALRLSRVVGRSPESWLLMQSNFDLHNEKKVIDLSECQPIDFKL